MSELDAYETPSGYGDTTGKCLTFAEIEALLDAERERCAAVADNEANLNGELADFFGASRSGFDYGGRHNAARQIAEAIRNLPPQPVEGQP